MISATAEQALKTAKASESITVLPDGTYSSMESSVINSVEFVTQVQDTILTDEYIVSIAGRLTALANDGTIADSNVITVEQDGSDNDGEVSDLFQ